MTKHDCAPFRLDSRASYIPLGAGQAQQDADKHKYQPGKTLGYCNPALILYNKNVQSWEHDCTTI